MEAGHAVRLSAQAQNKPEDVSTRQWLENAHQQLVHFLPEHEADPLLTDDLTRPSGEPVDVSRHFDMDEDDLQSLLDNYKGIRYSAEAASSDYHIDKPAPSWTGFEDIWIPIPQPKDWELSLSGRIGFARDGQGRIIDSDCIVILPGLFGDNGVKRSKDISLALRDSGFHVLSLEIRGHGQTEARYPNMYSTFGVMETDDLMHVSDWLEELPHVNRTGLIGYCWPANMCLFAAWYDGRPADDGIISPELMEYLTGYDPDKRRFEAGVIAFSPVLRWEVLQDELEYQRSIFGHPIYNAIQGTLRDRMQRKDYPNPSGNLRQLVQNEYEGYDISLPGGVQEGYPFLRLIPYKGRPAGDKLEHARVPVLIVHGADDPLSPAQYVADLMATVENPKVAAVILPSGGHVGFAGYSREYYLSLVTNFFDPRTGPADTTKLQTTAEASRQDIVQN
jgi:pimeloyl-ACP methyl ester carboxylesterase